MNTKLILPLAALLIELSACGHDTGPITASCQSRPSDARLANTISAINANVSASVFGVQTTADCTGGIVVYQLSNETAVRQNQLVGTDNGKWFIVHVVGLADVQLTEVQ